MHLLIILIGMFFDENRRCCGSVNWIKNKLGIYDAFKPFHKNALNPPEFFSEFTKIRYGLNARFYNSYL